ncbi:hypothetical protein [Streptomyces sp. cmx-18-6]|uniref:hypothetical protein n=1 Tax=Streptomyces sp. cmx-18-6 TaxID=2790930 RepID=UPI003980E862
MTPPIRSRAAVLVPLRTLALLEAVNIGLIGWVVFAAFGAPCGVPSSAPFQCGERGGPRPDGQTSDAGRSVGQWASGSVGQWV